MKLKKNMLKSSDFLFYLGWFIYIFNYMLIGSSELQFLYDVSTINKVVKVIVIFIFIFKIIFVNKYSYKKLLFYSLCLVISFCNALYVDRDTIFFALLIMFAADKIEIKKVIKFDMSLRLILLLLIFAMSFVGLLPNYMRVINGIYKQSLGFSHPNVLCFNLIIILLEFLYINKKINLKFVIINILILLFAYIFCFSRTAIYSYLIILTIYIMFREKSKIYNIPLIKIVFSILPIMLLGLSLYCIIEYGKGNPMMIQLNKLLTTRINWGYKFYDLYGITLFGSNIMTVSSRTSLLLGTKAAILDMGYMRLLISNGIVVCSIFIFLLCLYQKKLIDTKNYKLLLINTFFIICGFSETCLLSPLLNISLITFIQVVSSKDEKVIQDE